jgi:hypothetical protein
MQRENREFNASGDILGLIHATTEGALPFAKLAAGRHNILKERLTALPGTAVQTWLAPSAAS